MQTCRKAWELIHGVSEGRLTAILKAGITAGDPCYTRPSSGKKRKREEQVEGFLMNYFREATGRAQKMPNPRYTDEVWHLPTWCTKQHVFSEMQSAFKKQKGDCLSLQPAEPVGNGSLCHVFLLCRAGGSSNLSDPLPAGAVGRLATPAGKTQANRVLEQVTSTSARQGPHSTPLGSRSFLTSRARRIKLSPSASSVAS